ncbi:RNA-binding domain-containing protein [Roseomonas mucosa]|jgi:ATP-dependent DNA helicase RecG|uniref:RNA-binding domain-containing protein n=1 Tax=Roseomonas mucosa TaxID=207340 RepID=UPI0028CE8154|nr:RNA-binding domain-containing protein [Roseomonas mucosa]MDT8351863.1 putative DNA binding domain-containing protein [Roseomonas mucosa]QDD97345.1 DNA-binding protein [Roseomonas mucosa]
MTRDELLAKLQSIEWNDVEFKEAATMVPRNAFSTVSAFANTSGGYLVFGVKETRGSFSVTGVVEADNVQNDFLGQLRDLNKISVRLPVRAHLHNLPEGTVLAFWIPEAERRAKPVYIDRDLRKAFIRRGGRDDTCTADELLRFYRDGATERFDAEPLDLDIKQCFDAASLRWYRARFNASNPGRNEGDDDDAFLRRWSFVVEHGGVLLPTRAAILTLGADGYFRQILPRMAVDLQLYRSGADDYSPSVRWADRVTCEENLIQTWQSIVGFYFKHSERPFSVDAATFRRDDDPADYVSFREAAINLLIHQDFSDHTRLPVIRFFHNQTEFFNPGDAFSPRERLLDPGDKEVRNPSVVNAFRRIGLSDQGGTGVGAIFNGWRSLGYLPPEIDNDKADKTFRLTMRKEKLITEEQLLAQASLGASLSEHEAAVFAYLTRRGHIDLTDVKALTGLTSAAAKAVIERLVAQVLVAPLETGGAQYTLPAHLRSRYGPSLAGAAPQGQGGGDQTTASSTTEQATEQAADSQPELVRSLDRLTEGQWRVVEHADVPRSLADLMARAGYKQRPHFMAQYLEPLLQARVLRMTVPDKPRSPNQQYVLTEAGIKLRALRAGRQPAARPTNEADNE